MYTLKKINDEYYLTNEEKPSVGDLVIEYQEGDTEGEVHFINGEYTLCKEIQKKIIASTDRTKELSYLYKGQIELLIHKPKFRVGKNQGRAILYVEIGHEYLTFPTGKEEDAKEYCDYLNRKEIVSKRAIDIGKLADDYSETQITRNNSCFIPEWYDKTKELISRHCIDFYELLIKDQLISDVEKRFTLNDMQNAIIKSTEEGMKIQRTINNVVHIPATRISLFSNQYISNLTKEQTEWEVEIEMEVCGFNYTNLNIETPTKPKITKGYINILKIIK